MIAGASRHASRTRIFIGDRSHLVAQINALSQEILGINIERDTRRRPSGLGVQCSTGHFSERSPVQTLEQHVLTKSPPQTFDRCRSGTEYLHRIETALLHRFDQNLGTFVSLLLLFIFT